MSTNRKKTNKLSVSDIGQKINSKRSKRARSAEKASSSRDLSVQSNSELETVSDGHIVSSDLTTAAMANNCNPTVPASTSNSDKTVTAEGYNIFVNSTRGQKNKMCFL